MYGTATHQPIRLAISGRSARGVGPASRVAVHRSFELLELAVVFIVPVLLLLGLTVLFRHSNGDVAICRLFYGGGELGWPGLYSQPWDWLYHYGTYPGLIMGFGGAVVALASYVWSSLRPWREMGFFLTLLLALGPGLVINGVFKPQWGRPRPQQIKDFGGLEDYVGVWSLGSGGIHKSFPCGHASMGFYLMAPAFLLYRRRPRWALVFLALGITGGGILGLGRVVQGKHFPSDVVWSGGLVYVCGLFLAYAFHWASHVTTRETVEEPEPVILSIESARSDAARSHERQTRRRAA